MKPLNLNPMKSRYDPIIHYAVLLLTAIGVVFIFSAYTVPRLVEVLVADNPSLGDYLHPFRPFLNLLPVLSVGFAVYFSLLYFERVEEIIKKTRLGRRLFRTLSGLSLGKFILLFTLFTLFLLFVVLAEKVVFHMGVNRWLIGPKHTVLVTGMAVLAYYLFLAYQFSKPSVNWVKVLVYSFLFWSLLFLEPDVGTTVLLFFSFLTLLFFRTPERLHLFKWNIPFRTPFRVIYVGSTLLVVLLAFFAILNANVKLQLPNPFEGTKFGHVIVRINNWLDPFRDITDSSYQIANALYAVHRGGLDGVGYGFGLRKLYMGPTVHTDFIFATIGEETGFIFSIFVFIITLALLLRLLVISYRFKGMFEKFFTLLVAVETFAMALMNAGMAVNLIPSKGWPYPLISYAPFFVLFYIIQLGIVQYMVRKRFYEVF